MSASYSRHHPCRLQQLPRWDQQTEVIVVGFGASGASAAIEAATAGARVTILEVASGNGGTSALSGGEIYLGGSGGTPIQRSAGFSDATEDLYQYLLLAGGSDADAEKCRLYAENSLKHYEWLLAQGVVYKNSFIPTRVIEPFTDDCLIWSGSEEAWPFIDKARPCPRGHTPQFVGLGAGRYLMDRLAERVQALGVDVQYDSRVQALIADDHNRVHGVVVRQNNQDRFIRASKGVVLCAGGFIMNKTMLAQHAPKMLRANTPIGTVDDGSGIQLGQSVGGQAIHMNEGFVTIPWYPPQDLLKGIIINERGQRLINEDCYHGRVSQAILQDEGTRFFLLADSSFFAEPEWGQFAKISIAAAGETWEEVEKDLGLPEGALVSTVKVYSEHAAQGRDPLFHKQPRWLTPLLKPPFVALDLRIDHCIYSSFTLGGLHTRASGEVLDASGQAIAGLYAAGRTTSGLPRTGAGYSSGLSLADATFFGRQAGISVAKATSAG